MEQKSSLHSAGFKPLIQRSQSVEESGSLSLNHSIQIFSHFTQANLKVICSKKKSYLQRLSMISKKSLCHKPITLSLYELPYAPEHGQSEMFGNVIRIDRLNASSRITRC
jgi:hypothetical protein